MAKGAGGQYSENPEWKDIVPLPIEDGGPNALATIAYTEEYKEAVAYLRSIMTAQEYSQRGLQLTAHVIRMNPAHYTVWLYRAKTLDVLQAPIQDEVEWLNDIALQHIKNYQIWHHRQILLTRLRDQFAKQNLKFDASSERAFLNQMFEKDAKNYHVWSYRQWLVATFNLWDSPEELEDVERWLHADVHNNSAWNHRWYLSFARDNNTNHTGWKPDDAVIDREIEYAQTAIKLEPRNESSWSYLNGVMKKSGRPVSDLESFAREFVPSLDDHKSVRSTHALNTLASILEKNGNKQDAGKAYDILGKKLDQIRHNYWEYRKSCLGLPADNDSMPEQKAPLVS